MFILVMRIPIHANATSSVPDDEICILWNDKELDVDWPIKNPRISKKDLEGITIKEFQRL